MTTTTPNMNLVLPDVLMTVGPTWASLLNAAYAVIDSHNHSTGEGVAITPAGMNISSDLSFASNNATNLRTARLTNNSSISLGINDRTCLYALNNELYYEDGAGNTVQVTANGALNLAGGVTSLTLNDSAFLLQYFGDTSRKFRFSAASIPTSTTRIFTLPDNGTGNSTLVSIDATQTLTNKTFDSTSTATGIKIASLTSDGSHTLTFPTSTDTLVGKATTDTLINKIITGNTAATLKPDGVAVLTLPVATDTLVGKATTDTLSNKTLTTPIISTTATFTEISTPSNPASGKLAIYAKSDDNFYSLNSAGLEQQIGAGGAGGAINYISNSGFENGTVGGWATYSGGTTTPTNGTGGSPSSTFAASTSSPLRGTYSGLWTKSANNRQGEGFSYAFTLATADLGKTLQITFDALASAGMVSGDMTVYIYDVTNSVLITPSSINVPTGTSSQYSLAFQATTGTSYRLIFHTSTTSATAYTLQVDAMAISPIVRPMVAGESDWVAYTPSYGAGFGTVSTNNTFWRRVGDSIEVEGFGIAGTVAGSLCTITLPNNVTLNSSKLPNRTSGQDAPSIGTWGSETQGGNVIAAVGTSTTLVYFSNLWTGNNLAPTNGSTILANGSGFTFRFTAPITQWSSNITLASTTPMIEYVYNTAGTTTAGASDTTSFGYGAQGAAIGSIASTTVTGQSVTTMRTRFQNAIQPTDRIVLEIQNATSGVWLASGSSQIDSATESAAQYGVYFTVQNTTDINVAFGNGGAYSTGLFGAAGTAWSTLTSYRWRVAKYSSIGGAELAPATVTSQGTVAFSGWTAYTPIISAGLGTATAISFFYRREGDSVRIKGHFTSGTVASSVPTISIPSGLNIDTTKINTTAYKQSFGLYVDLHIGTDISTAGGMGALIYDGSTTTSVQMARAAGSGIYTNINGTTLSSSHTYEIQNILIPISSWS